MYQDVPHLTRVIAVISETLRLYPPVSNRQSFSQDTAHYFYPSGLTHFERGSRGLRNPH